MLNLWHPSSLLQQEWLNIIRTHAANAEKTGMLTQEQTNLLYNQRWLKLLAPSRYNGIEMDLPEVIKLEEALAWADGSLGWVVTLCTGAGWFGGFMEPELAKEILTDEKACLAGSGAVTGTAEKTGNRYLINGKWLYASGATIATAFTANCKITENGNIIQDNHGNPLVLPFVFYKNEVNILDTWNAMGMVATASHAFEVKNLSVPADRVFRIDSSAAKSNGALYNYPFLQLAETTLAANISGMALHFIDECETLFTIKNSRQGTPLINDTKVHETLKQAKHQLSEARMTFYNLVELSWKNCVTNSKIDNATLTKISSAAHALAEAARQNIDYLYPYCGLSETNKDSVINRIWRDLHTASQHSLLVFGA